MPSWGLLEEGFSAKPATVIREELDTAMAGIFGESILIGGEVPPQTKIGQLVGMMTDGLSGMWDQQGEIDASTDPDQATGAQLDAACAITGTLRDGSAYSTVTATATGTPATALLEGRVASVTGTRARFASLADATIVDAGTWVALTAYALDDRRYNGARVYQVTTAGTSAAAVGPTGTGTGIVDGTVVWRYLGEGTGVVDVEMQAQVIGAVNAAAGALATIETPVTGWLTVTNLSGAVVGNALETDSSLRLKRAEELASSGNATADAIRANILALDGVTSCRVFYNDTDAVVDTIPPHSVEVLVLGGDDQEIADEVFASVAAGIGYSGNQTDTVVDSNGVSHTVKWSRPVEVPIFARLDVVKYATTFPSDGSDQIKAAVVAYGNSLGVGRSVRSQPLGAIIIPDPVYGGGITGILDVTLVYIGLADPPVAAVTIAIATREISTFTTTRIAVNLSNGTP